MAGYFRDRARPQHHRRVAVIEVAHLDQIGLLRRLVGERVFRADNGGKAVQQFGVEAGLVEHGVTLVEFPEIVIARGALDQCAFRKAI